MCACVRDTKQNFVSLLIVLAASMYVYSPDMPAMQVIAGISYKST